MLHCFYFSPSNTTKKISELITNEIDSNHNLNNVTLSSCIQPQIETGDVVLLAAPVYAGRIPQLAAERFSSIKGSGQKAIVVAVYGNRDYDDALLELCDLAKFQGFDVVAAGAFIAQHCIFPKVASNRPDKGDEQQIAKFAENVKRAISSDSSLSFDKVKGNRPYKKASAVPLHPQVDESVCNECGTCAHECPAEAINKANPHITDTSKCISCCRCINVCPKGARRFGGAMYKLAGWKYVKDNARRLEPEWFV